MEKLRPNHLNHTEEALLALLRAGLWQAPPAATDLALFPLPDHDWQDIFHLASNHTIIGPVFQGICLLPDTLMPPPDMLDLWVAHVDHIERQNRTMTTTVETLLNLFTTNGLHPILQKGIGVAAFYQQPLQRTSGDIDICFPNTEEDHKATHIIQRIGLNPHRMDDGALTYKYKGIQVEHHTHLLDIHNPFCHKSITQLTANEGRTSHTPSPLTNLLLLSTHILKHIIGPGIGLRQIADMARACYTLNGQYDSKAYTYYCHKWHIEGWTKELHTFLTDYLGLPQQMLPSPERKKTVSRHIVRKIIEGGNFGKHHNDLTSHNSQGIKKKLYTARHTLADARHSLTLSPTETIFFTLHLLKRQLF